RWSHSLPFQRSLLPHINEAEEQHAHENTHLDQADDTEIPEHGCPGHDEDDFQIENDELDRDEVIAHVELHARVFEGLEAAFVGGQFREAGAPWPKHVTHYEKGDADT